MLTRDLLIRYIELINSQGVNSPEAAKLRVKYRHKREFIELAGLTRKLKIYLSRDDDGGLAGACAKLIPPQPGLSSGVLHRTPKTVR